MITYLRDMLVPGFNKVSLICLSRYDSMACLGNQEFDEIEKIN